MRVLVSPIKKLCMFWSPKAGCSTATAIFFKYCDFDYSDYKWIHDAREQKYETNVHPSILPDDHESYVKLQIVRDPYPRAVSSFFHYLKHCRPDEQFTHKQLPDLFLEFLLNVKENKLNCDSGAFHAQIQYMIDDVDFILKLENIDSDIEIANRKFGLKLENVRYDPHSWAKKLGAKYKEIYSNLYDTETRFLVREIYQKDFEFFRY